MGTDWIQSGTTYKSTFHHLPFAFANHPDNSSWFVQQAASSMNTTRPQFNFDLRRRSHRVHNSGYNQVGIEGTSVKRGNGGTAPKSLHLWSSYYGGGRSGNMFYSDWIIMHVVRRLPPVDPSFADALGAIRLLPLQVSLDDDAQYVNGTFGSFNNLKLVDNGRAEEAQAAQH